MTDPTDQQPPSHEQIAEQAYQIYLARTAQGTPGDDVSDWYQAEQALANPQP